jgi:hypothetical protein
VLRQRSCYNWRTPGGNSSAANAGNGGNGLGGGIANLDTSTFDAFTSFLIFNVAQGGADIAGGNGGDGLGGGIYIEAGGTGTTLLAFIFNNQALGGSGATNGSGIGGGVYRLGTFVDIFDMFAGNQASTSNNDIGP